MRLVRSTLVALFLAACSTTTPVVPGTECELTGCDAGETCNPATHRCESDSPVVVPPGDCAEACGADEQCVDGTCTACRTDITCTGRFTACGAGESGCAPCRDNTCGGAFPHCLADSGCSQCVTDADCSSAAPHCAAPHCVECKVDGDCTGGEVCRGGSCTVTGCMRDTDCPADRPFCDSFQQDPSVCEQCRTDAECGPGTVCSNGNCRTALPGNGCTNPLAVTVGDTPLVLQGSTAGYTGNVVSYAVTLEEDSLLSVDLQTDTYADARLVLAGACGQDDAQIANIRPGRDEPITDRFLAAGTYSLLVQVIPFYHPYFGASERFTLTLSRKPGARVEGNDCSKAIVVPVGAPGGQTATVTGDTTGLLTLPNEACGPEGDVAYRLELQEHSLVRATLTPAPDVDLAFTLRQGSCYQSVLCGTPVVGAPVTQTLRGVPPGEAMVLVQTRNAPGPYTLEVLTRPYPTNTACYAALPLEFVDGVAEVTANTDEVPESYAGCDIYDELEAVHYTFSTVGLGERSVRFDLVSQESGIGKVSLTTGCRTSGTQPRVCGAVSVDEPRLPEGTYHVQVASAGRFTLRATLGPPLTPPANDACTAPQEVTLSANRFGPIAGTTIGATSQLEFACGYGNQQGEGRDVAYHLTVPGRGRLSVTATPGEASFNPLLQLGTTCESSGARCARSEPAGAAETVSVRTSSEAYLWVDSEDKSEGPFTLSGTFTPPPAHDVCASAVPIAVGQTVTGSISEAFGDANACDTSGREMNLFYSFQTGTNPGTLTLTLTPEGFDGSLGVFAGSCGATSCHRWVDNYVSGGAETLTLSSLAKNTTYLIAVGGGTLDFGDPAGTFTLALTAP